MSGKTNFTVENMLKKEKRGLNVYHHSSRGAHLISCGSSVTLPLGNTEEEDYLHISVVRGPGDLWKNCLINVPSWADFQLSTDGKVLVSHAGDRTLLDIPPGPPTWQLKITRPPGARGIQEDTVTVCNGKPGAGND